MKNIKKISFLLIVFFLYINIYSLDLSVLQENIQLQRAEGGYHLYVQKKTDINSILLVETTKDPEYISTNYAYRAETWNEYNGDEKRILDGKILDSPGARYSLIDSTTEKHEKLGDVFHIFIPNKILWGYSWTRNGHLEIGMGTFVNIRSFSKPYADYSGEFLDNPFMFNFTPIETVLTDNYNPVAAGVFENIAKSREGTITYSKGPETIADDILKAITKINPKDKVDVVFAIDSTGSMKDDIEVLRKEFVPKLEKELHNFKSLRLGLLLYRDYGDNYNYKNMPVKFMDFTKDVNKFYNQLNNFKIYGTEGGDIPEAVYEALYSSLEFYNWDNNAIKKIILIGDAEPHPKPRGIRIKCTREMVYNIAKQKGVIIDTIITPDDKSKRIK